MKTTNKYPEFITIKTEEVNTDAGMFEMSVHKEKCGQAFVVEFIQKSVIMNNKDYPFVSKVLLFKYIDGVMKYDPTDVMKSNFKETIKPNKFDVGYTGSIVYLKQHIEFSKRHLDESIRGN